MSAPPPSWPAASAPRPTRCCRPTPWSPSASASPRKSPGSCRPTATATSTPPPARPRPSGPIASWAAEEYRDLAQEVIYGGSRVEVGGGRLRGDGSVGAWAAKFVHDYGVVPRGVHGRYDLSRYDERRCREYGARGVPGDLE